MSFLRLNIKFLVIFGVAFCYAKTSFSQSIDSTFSDFDYIKNKNLWSESDNPAGLQYIPTTKVSTAKVFYEKSNGTFKNYYHSDNSFKVGAETESYYRLNKNVVFYGKANYQNFRGENMQGSALVDPYSHPLGFEEGADTTAGTKKLEGYHLAGMVSARISPKILLGGKVDYAVADYAKIKDLRHVNSLLNMNTGAGLTYTPTKGVELGLSYFYTRRIESLKFEVHGNTDKQYLVFLNYGNFYGRTELFGEAGYSEEKRPLVNNTNKTSLQVKVDLGPKTSWLNEFSFANRKGYFGKRGTAAIVFTEHSALQYAYSGTLRIQRRENTHLINLKGSFEDLQNMQNLYNQGTTPGGNNMIIYYGENKVLEQQLAGGSVNYSGYFNVIGNNPVWTVDMQASFVNRYQKSALFPFYRKQDLNMYNACFNLKRNIFAGGNMFSLSLGLGYGGGSGMMNYDGLYQPPSSSQRYPVSRDSYLQQEYEFLTQTRWSMMPEIQYSHNIKNKTYAYIKASGNITNAFNTEYLGRTYNTVGISIGYVF